MTELEKLVQTWEKYKPIGTPHERIWNGFIDDAKAAIEREKQALIIANVVWRSKQLVCPYCGNKRIGQDHEGCWCRHCKREFKAN
jgi:tRNA(Ile2) C34 agmatinyltransferase TiaS